MCFLRAICLPTITFRSPRHCGASTHASRAPRPRREVTATSRDWTERALLPCFRVGGTACGLPIPELSLSLVFKRWIFLLCLRDSEIIIEENPCFQYQMLLWRCFWKGLGMWTARHILIMPEHYPCLQATFLPTTRLGEDGIGGLSPQLPAETRLPYVTCISDDSNHRLTSSTTESFFGI